ncbi:MAG: hypothetical protein WAM14_06770 [Candidatus Nitrosopolaris sp.]
MLTGYHLYHNYFRPHQALDGKTPADKITEEIFDYTKGDPVMVRFSVIGKGLEQDVGDGLPF